MASLQRRHRAQAGDDIGQIGRLRAGIKAAVKGKASSNSRQAV
jgi:hypothetical protein